MIEQYLTNKEFETCYPKLSGLRSRITQIEKHGLGHYSKVVLMISQKRN